MSTTTRVLEDLKGRIIWPNDADYDELRTVYDGGFDSHPSMIVRVADDSDVTRVIAHARETGLELAIMSGGHSFAGHSTTNGGILLDLRGRKGFEIDLEGRSAWAETGLTTGEVTSATQGHDLVVGFGDTASVGIGGLTLGGGMGYLVRRHGLTIDSLLAARIVTSDGQVLHVDAESHPDLFWAIRGGGGNFGVVTRFQYRLHAMPSCYCGFLVLPATAEVIAGFVEAALQAPEELSAILNIMPAPPLPFPAEKDVGHLVAMAGIVYVGDAVAGERALARFRALAAPLADMVQSAPYGSMFPPDEGGSSRSTTTSTTLFLDAFDLSSAETIVARLQESDATMRVTQLRVLGGAMARVQRDSTAFAHRSCPIMANLAAFYDGPDERVRREDWVAEFAAALPHVSAGAYVNFLASSGEAQTRRAYPSHTMERLAEVKRIYDSGNLFHRNHNIPPS